MRRLRPTSGASEIDMVIDIGAALCGDIGAVRSGISSACPAGCASGVIVSRRCCWDGAHTLVDACRAASPVPTSSTGCHPAGGATVRAVELMAERSALGAKVKQSGIRTAADAVAPDCHQVGPVRHRAVLDGLS